MPGRINCKTMKPLIPKIASLRIVCISTFRWMRNCVQSLLHRIGVGGLIPSRASTAVHPTESLSAVRIACANDCASASSLFSNGNCQLWPERRRTRSCSPRSTGQQSTSRSSASGFGSLTVPYGSNMVARRSVIQRTRRCDTAIRSPADQVSYLKKRRRTRRIDG